jgi:hypothetical protein
MVWGLASGALGTSDFEALTSGLPCNNSRSYLHPFIRLEHMEASRSKHAVFKRKLGGFRAVPVVGWLHNEYWKSWVAVEMATE